MQRYNITFLGDHGIQEATVGTQRQIQPGDLEDLTLDMQDYLEYGIQILTVRELMEDDTFGKNIFAVPDRDLSSCGLPAPKMEEIGAAVVTGEFLDMLSEIPFGSMSAGEFMCAYFDSYLDECASCPAYDTCYGDFTLSEREKSLQEAADKWMREHGLLGEEEDDARK